MQSLDAIVKRLDIPRAQVLVEAIIVEVTADDGKALGVDWLFSNKHGGFGSNSVTGSGTLGGVANAFFEEDAIDKLKGLGGALAGTVGGTYGLGKYSENGTSLAAILTAVEQTKQANVLSTPSVLTLDNHEATIVVGKEVSFTNGSYTSTGTNNSSTPGNPFQTIDRESVGITLKVTPRISEGDNVELEIMQESSELAGAISAGGNQDTNERKIETTVVTRDGKVIVLGGLMQDKVRETEKKVPWLGDIPLLGRLFRFHGTDVVKTNLLVFIKPTILRDDERLEDLSSEKYNAIRDLQIKKREQGVDLYPDDVTPVLPAWEKQTRNINAIRKAAAQDSAASAEG
jgi:general secretion pathway protein D